MDLIHWVGIITIAYLLAKFFITDLYWDIKKVMLQMERHTHKYIRIRVGRNKTYVWRCALPGCVHKIRDKELMYGRKSICNICGDEYILTKELVNDKAKLHCSSCTNSTKQKMKNALAEKLFGEIELKDE